MKTKKTKLTLEEMMGGREFVKDISRLSFTPDKDRVLFNRLQKTVHEVVDIIQELHSK